MNSFEVLRWLTVGLLSLTLVLWGWRFRRRSFVRDDRWAITVVAAVQLLSLVAYYGLFWHQLAVGKATKGLLRWPSPYVTSHVLRDLTSLVVGWLAALLLLLILRRVFLIRGKGLMLDGTDIALLVVATGVVGWPGFFLMLAATFALSIVGMIVLVIIRKRKIDDRLIITPFIIPAAVAVLVFLDKLLAWSHLAKIGF